MKGAFEQVRPTAPVTAPEERRPPRTSAEAAPVDLMSTLSKLKSVATAPPGSSPLGALERESPDNTQPSKIPKREVSPGPTEAASGMTVHQIMRDPVTLGALADEIARWEEQNPNRKLLGPAMAQIAQNVLPDISEGQAARLAKRINAERKKLLMGKDEVRANKASASASLGRGLS